MAWDFDDGTSNLTDPDVLRIQTVLDEPTPHQFIKMVNVTLVGLTQKAWDYSRGARTTRDYVDDADNMVVQHVYSYTYANGNRDIDSVTHTFNWYNNDGTVGLSKTINKVMTVKSMGMLNREVRIGRMTDLRENAKLVAGGQALIDAIYGWYGDLILEYEDIGDLAFENALKNETDPVRTGTLNAAIPEFGGLTVMQLLSWQLVGAYSWT